MSDNPLDYPAFMGMVMGTAETEEVEDGVFVHTFNPLPPEAVVNPLGHIVNLYELDGQLIVEYQVTPEGWERLFGPPWWKRMLSLKAWSKVIALAALDKITRPFGGA